MVRIVPFHGYRPRADIAHRVACPPYDVLSSEEARVMAEGNELSFLHVNKPEIDLPTDISPYDDRVYEQGARFILFFFEKKLILYLCPFLIFFWNNYF